MELIIAFWRIATLSCNWDDEPVANKIAGYRDKATRVLDQLVAERSRLGFDGAKLVFIAPEHLFRCSTLRMAMPESDKKQIVTAVKQISSRYADAMIIPGTIVWLEETAFATLFKRKYEARNSAFVFCNGSIVFQYNKHSDAGELLQAEQANAKFRPGKKLGVFKHWGLRFGMEICFDHSHSTLYRQLQEKKKSAVDVHLVVSSTVPNQGGKVAAKHGGLLVHADGGDTRDSHTAQPGTTGAKTGIWKVKERDTPRGGGTVPDVAEHKRLNRGQYIDLKRRYSVTERDDTLDAPPAFQGFEDDVSVYHVKTTAG